LKAPLDELPQGKVLVGNKKTDSFRERSGRIFLEVGSSRHQGIETILIINHKTLVLRREFSPLRTNRLQFPSWKPILQDLANPLCKVNSIALASHKDLRKPHFVENGGNSSASLGILASD